MGGRKGFRRISETEFASVLATLSATAKGRAFLEEYRRRAEARRDARADRLAATHRNHDGERQQPAAAGADRRRDPAHRDVARYRGRRRRRSIPKATRRRGASRSSTALAANCGARRHAPRPVASTAKPTRRKDVFEAEEPPSRALAGRYARLRRAAALARPVGGKARRQHVVADIAAGKHDHDRPPGDLKPPGKKRGKPDRAAGLDHQPQLVEGKADGEKRLRVARDDGPGKPRPVDLPADRAGLRRQQRVADRAGLLALRCGVPAFSERA